MPKESQASYNVYKDIFYSININIREVTKCLKILHQSKLLTKENFNVVKEHKDCLSLSLALSKLKEANLLTQEYFNALKEHEDCLSLILALYKLKQANLLTQENFNVVKEHNNCLSLSLALSRLKEANLLTQENFNAVKEHKDCLNLTEALSTLKEANLLTQENFNAVKEHKDCRSLSLALSTLKEANLLTQEYFNALKEHNNCLSLSFALSTLKEANLLTQENFNVVKEHKDCLSLSFALSKLKQANLLTQENFTKLLDPHNGVLFTLIIRRNTIWRYIPTHLLTQEVFEELIRRASLLNPGDHIQQYINLLLDINNAGINNDQNTHTASIHTSVSASACHLMKRYGDKLLENSAEKIITTLKEDISKLPDNLKNKAAKKCIGRISQFNFADPDSKITIQQLLALSYLARHDDDNRQGNREDANQQFIDELYEIQRGYNLSANGIDDQRKDSPICTAGTFNKLMEKLSGVHTDVKLLFITKAIATQKLPIIVYEEVKNYLQKLSKPETKEGFHSFITLLEQLLKDGIEIIWNKIKPQVADRLFDEFKSIYNNNKENSDFLDLVDAGQYTQMKNLGNYQQQILSSAGYRKYCSQMLENSAKFVSLFFQLPSRDNESTKWDVKEPTRGVR